MTKTYFAIFILIIISVVSYGQNNQQDKYGYNDNRIAYTADGNKGDTDDFGASPAALAILAKANLQQKLVHFDYNSHLGQSLENNEKQMRLGVNGAIHRWGFDKSVFFDDMVDLDGAVANLTKQINISSKNDPLYIILAGPCEVVYQAAVKANPGQCKHVYLLSHSGYNDRYKVPIDDPHTKDDLVSLGCNYKKIKDQNGSKYPDRLYDSRHDWSVWAWMKTHRDPDIQWLYTRVKTVGRGDISDSGMVYYLLTGDENGSPSKLEKYFGHGINAKPPVNSNKPSVPPINRIASDQYFLESDGILIMEAESTFSDYNKWVLKTSNPGFTGSGHLEFTGNSPASGPPTSPLIYNFRISKPGQYQLLIRAQKRLDGQGSDKCNDGYVRIEGDYTAGDIPRIGPLEYLKTNTKFYGGATAGWEWASKLDRGHQKYTPSYNFEQGDYSLIISGRSQRWNIDRILLVHQDADKAIAKSYKNPESEIGGIILAKPTPQQLAFTMENIVNGQKVAKYTFEAFVDSQWLELKPNNELKARKPYNTNPGFETIGHKKIDRVTPVTTNKIRFRCLESVAQPVELRQLMVYNCESIDEK